MNSARLAHSASLVGALHGHHRARNQVTGDRNISDRANREQTEILRLSSESLLVRHVGLWLNFRAWTGAATPPYYNAGVEPTTFPHDDLKVAAREHGAQVPPGATLRWDLTVSVTRDDEC